MESIVKLLKYIDVINATSKFELRFDAFGGYVEFSNTSGKSFVIGLNSILQTIKDILQNLPQFLTIQKYDEKPWRDMGSTYYRDSAANTVSTVQTKPFYTTLAKFIAFANDDLANYSDDLIDLDGVKLNNTIAFLDDIIALFKINLEELEESDVEDSEGLLNKFSAWLIDLSTDNYFNKSLDKAISEIKQYQEKYIESFGTDLFDVDFSDLEKSIELIRENVYDRSSKFWDYSDNTSSHQPKVILGDKNYLRFLKEYNPVANAGTEIVKGYNKIFFGAPGTGKSYSIAKKLQGVSEEQIERVIFHPDYDYSSFVGGYKPVTEKDDEGKDVVKYKFVPQVFTNIFEKAHRNPRKNFYLVIEEINRGNCAEIFGDIFQLLDRNPDYAITPSEDLHKFLKDRDESARHKVLKNAKMTMPDNLVILATMNTSDQSLFPMDSAFKRRWDWEYVAIKYPMDEKDSSCPSFSYRVKLDDEKYFKWMDFVANVNKHILQNPSLGVDKCIGNFFIKPDKENIISLDSFINKVIFYLWNDVFKDEENEIFADHTYLSYFPQTEGQRRINEMIEKFRVQSGGMFFFKFNSEGVEVTADIDLGK